MDSNPVEYSSIRCAQQIIIVALCETIRFQECGYRSSDQQRMASWTAYTQHYDLLLNCAGISLLRRNIVHTGREVLDWRLEVARNPDRLNEQWGLSGTCFATIQRTWQCLATGQMRGASLSWGSTTHRTVDKPQLGGPSWATDKTNPQLACIVEKCLSLQGLLKSCK